MLLLDTVNKTTIWGGTRLQKFGADPLNTRVGSLYTVAGNEELTCTVLNGEFIGMTLHEVYAADPARFGCPQFPVFPQAHEAIRSYIQRTGENMSAVVVGVLTDQIDPPRGGKSLRQAVCAKYVSKFLYHFIQIHKLPSLVCLIMLS